MEADVHRDPQLAEWPGDDTERPGDDTATGDEVLEIVCTFEEYHSPSPPSPPSTGSSW